MRDITTLVNAKLGPAFALISKAENIILSPLPQSTIDLITHFDISSKKTLSDKSTGLTVWL